VAVEKIMKMATIQTYMWFSEAKVTQDIPPQRFRTVSAKVKTLQSIPQVAYLPKIRDLLGYYL